MAKKQILLYGSIFVVGAVAAVAITSLLVNIWERKHEASQYPFRVVEVAKDELDPAVWGKNFPHQYDSFMQTKENYGKTPYGGSAPYSKLEVSRQ